MITRTSPRSSTDFPKLVSAAVSPAIGRCIDVHTHLGSIGQGSYVLDSFATGTVAAALGGTTTVVDFASPAEGQGMLAGVESYHEKASGESAVDYGFHVFCVGASTNTLSEMDRLVDEGVSSFKMFMAYPGSLYSDDGEILQVMQRSAENGALVMMHAENGIAIDVLRAQAVERGRDVLDDRAGEPLPERLGACLVGRGFLRVWVGEPPGGTQAHVHPSAVDVVARRQPGPDCRGRRLGQLGRQ